MGRIKKPQIDSEKRALVAQMAAQGKSYRSIAAAAKVSKSAVGRMLTEDVPLVPQRGTPQQGRPFAPLPPTVADARKRYEDALLAQCEAKAGDAVDYLHSVILGETDDVEQPGCRERITASGVLLTNIGRLRQARATESAPAPQIVINALSVKT
jgi:hypothetical protein